ncbi:MAG: chorismate synthase [Coriobacteriales bacterium]|nr:chorismate synthase [Actinomycetes bacterium]
MHYTTAGESHGKALVSVVSDVPAGIRLDSHRIDADLARRQKGYGRGGRMAIESDRAVILSGVRFGRTIGSPVAMTIGNRDWDNWTDVMATSGDGARAAKVTSPRPGHADLAGVLRNNTDDVRDVLERASARETAARVAAGAVAKALLGHVGVGVASFVVRIGDVALDSEPEPEAVDFEAAEVSDVSCPDPVVSARMRDAIDAARSAGESLGGVFVVAATGLVPGLGGYAEASQRLDARLGAAVLSIPAIKGVEFGDGFAAAARVGSAVHDPILFEPGRGIVRPSNHAGGLEGGMTNGQTLVVRAAMKPIPTLMRPLASVDLATGEPVDAAKERSDVCAVPAAAVVAEAEVAMVLADAYTQAFGVRSVDDILEALEAYRARLPR